jgi:glutamate dehydrogenase/leucine dehydrogenase
MYKKIRNEATAYSQAKDGMGRQPDSSGSHRIWYCVFRGRDAQNQGTELRWQDRPGLGSGNVSQYAIQKVNQLGGKVVTASDSDGFIYDPDGIKGEKWEYLLDLKNVKRGRISEYAEEFGVKYFPGARPWGIEGQIALPCATRTRSMARKPAL